LFLQKEEHT